jgi:two-component system response regulator YesN
MKLILIEDEPESLLGMKQTVESIDMDFTLFTSNNPEQAMDIISEHMPELVVTDIMLPNMTGLDLIERITGEHYQPKVIIVSGYNDFEYARRSIRIGAVDYLLKPFSTGEFKEKIRKAMVSIQENNSHYLELKQQKTFADIGNRSMRDNYLIDFCLKRSVLEEHLYQRLRLWGIEWVANQTFSLIVLDAKGHPDGKPLGREFSLKTFAIGNIAEELLFDYSPSLLFKDPQNRWVIITGSEDVAGLTQKLHDGMKQYHKFPVALGVTPQVAAFNEIHPAYNEALKAFRINALSDHPEYFFHSDHDDDSLLDDISSPAMMTAMISQRDEAMIQKGVRHFISHTMLSDDMVNREGMIRYILNYLSRIHVTLSETLSKELGEIPMKVWESFDDCRTLEESESVLNEYLVNLSREITPAKTNAMVERALQIISAGYMQDITLQIIADQLSLHPVWLSQLFKRETGRTYSECLTETRIEHAKALLRETSLKVYEIAESVGYHDLQHFGNTFKKKTGQTPKEYRYGK